MTSNSLVSKGVGLACCGAAAVLPLAGFANPAQERTLVIRWQRLVDVKGGTCDRCGNTERSIDEAHRLLSASLKPLDLHVQVVKSQLTPQQFKINPSESNRVWISDVPLEKILDAKTGDSPCCGDCGGSNCRTMIVDGRTYETIPAELIVRAGLRLAADLVKIPAPAASCCASSGAPAKSDAPDMQPMPWKSRDHD